MIWNDDNIKQFEHEIEWLKNKILKGVSKKQELEYNHQIRKKQLDITFNHMKGDKHEC